MSEPTEVALFHGALVSQKQQIASRLPSHMQANVDRMIKVAMTTAIKTPAILRCSKESIMTAIFTAAELGLEPGGSLGEAYLVPYGNTCQFIPGYRGLISLARRSGQIMSIEARIVYEKDEFDFSLGLNPTLTHKPNLEASDRGEMRFVYAIARLRDGATQFEPMSKSEVDAIRKRSRASGSGPWVTDYNEMARKTAIRRLFKYLPVSTELVRALEIQAQAEAGDFGDLDQSKDVSADLNDLQAQAAQAAKARGKSASEAVAEGAQV